MTGNVPPTTNATGQVAVVSLDAVACKVCNSRTELHGCVDAGRGGPSNIYLPLSGVPIYYHRCLSCGFLFTVAFDSWSLDDFRRGIYDEGYAAADPDYANGTRARGNAALTANIAAQLGARHVLDYGGGDGTLARELCLGGLAGASWDPVADKPDAMPAKRDFDLVTAFEVFEHTPTPHDTTEQVLSFVRPGGRLLFSTLLMDGLPRQATDHWYIAPRNGHISLHTSASLSALFARFGWGVHSFNANLHIAGQPSG